MIDDGHSDAELVRRFKGGDRDAFTGLVRRHQDRIFRLALVLLDDKQNATDAAQEVFLRAFKGLARFRFQAEPFTWLFRTTKNVCREYNRARSFETLEREPIDATPNPAAGLDQAQSARVIKALVMDLPERQRDAVMLRVFEELSTNDTARAMGCRPGTVKALLHKAIQRLKRSDEMAALAGSLAMNIEGDR